MKKSFHWIVLILGLFLLLIPSDFANAASRWDQTDVPTNKEWKIEFSKEVDSSTIHNSIFIEDSKGNRLTTIDVTVNEKNPKIVQVKNLFSYESNETYHLHITDDVKSIDGTLLNQPVHMEFSTLKTDTRPELTAKEIVQLNDSKVVMIETDLAQGSGVIVGEGLVLTNDHVIYGAQEGKVLLTDGTEYDIEGIVARDEIKDLALIKTTKKINVSPVEIGSYTSLEKGDTIFAIGSPYGLQNTISQGIVSSFRSLDDVQLIQINAGIDHGSSGGGLFNNRGELVGITTSGYGSVANLNFAVAIDEAEPWFNYFSIKFEQIKATPLEDIVYPIFGDIALYMTKAEVKKLAPGRLVSEDKNSLEYEVRNLLGYDATVYYEFANNELMLIEVTNLVNEDSYSLEDYFWNMYFTLAEIYGEEIYFDFDWFDDEEGFSLSSYWELINADLMLITYISENPYDEVNSYGGYIFADWEYLISNY